MIKKNAIKEEATKKAIHDEMVTIYKEKEKMNECNQDILIPIKKNQEEKIKIQQDFNETFSKLNSTDMAIINESISKCIYLAQYNIDITHQNLEFILELAFRLGRNNELYGKILSFASYILLTRPFLGSAIIDSEIMSQYIQLLYNPMNEFEIKFMDNFFATSIDVFRSAISNFNFVERIVQCMNDPAIPANDFLNLLRIVTGFIKSYPMRNQVDPKIIDFIGDISLFLFNTIVRRFIYSDNELIFGEICHLYMLILEDSTKNEFYQFLLSNGQPENPNPQIGIDDLLLERLKTLNHSKFCSYVIGIFLNFSSSAVISYAQQLYQRGILPKFQAVLSFITGELNAILLLQTIQNFFYLGKEVSITIILEIASSNFTNLALKLLKEGGFPAKKAAINYFCGLCSFTKDQNIQNLIVQQNIISELMEFIDIPDPKIWHEILVALYKNCQAAYSSGVEESNLFDHPLFQSIDVNDFYQSLCKIKETIDERKEKKENYNIELDTNVLYFLDLINDNMDISD